jgi:hypothetical protein
MSPQDFLDLKLGQAARKGGILTETVLLTPELAEELLQRNPDNRSFKQIKLINYTKDILEDRWVHNSQTISVSDTGELNNGQHRCQAVIDANKAIVTEMSFGESRQARMTHDIGATRHPGDILKFSGHANGVHLAALTKLVLAYEATANDELRSFATSRGARNAGIPEINQRVNGPDADLLAEAASFASTNTKLLKGRLVPSMIGFAYWLLCSANHEQGKLFMETLANQNGTGATDPEWHLFRNLQSKHDHRRPLVEVAESVVRAYNLRRQGKVGQRSSPTRGHIPTPRI